MTGRELELIREVLESNYLNEGEVTERFEQAIAAKVGAPYVVATTSGTAAIFLALAAVGVGPGDDVVVPDLTFIATANAVRLAGARVVLADIDPATLTLDVASFERAITPRTRAVVPVHVSGRSADMRSIRQLARQRGIAVVEDAAEAFMSGSDDGYLGTLGDAGCLSFSPNKTITTGQGGAVLTRDQRLSGRLRELKDQGRPVRGTGGDDVHPTVGFNFKLTNLQAAVGLAQLTALEERLARQERIYREYKRILDGVEGIRLPGFRLGRGEVPLWTDAVVQRRDQLDQHLRERGMSCRRFWFPLHAQAPYRQPATDYPIAARLSPLAIWLPSAFTMSDADVEHVATAIASFLAQA